MLQYSVVRVCKLYKMADIGQAPGLCSVVTERSGGGVVEHIENIRRSVKYVEVGGRGCACTRRVIGMAKLPADLDVVDDLNGKF